MRQEKSLVMGRGDRYCSIYTILLLAHTIVNFVQKKVDRETLVIIHIKVESLTPCAITGQFIPSPPCPTSCS